MRVRMLGLWRSTCDALTAFLSGFPSMTTFFAPPRCAGEYFLSWRLPSALSP
ncbi:MAG: hypothetical protein OXF07_15315 [Rhodobacter sp.]|nr:hypothetical protein [Rhodobacter sp.]MCY4169945.1 hypothetical protein [Rhodobacter sp.]MCY4243018.1 hypothetical protein [Rhodobacter sp.]